MVIAYTYFTLTFLFTLLLAPVLIMHLKKLRIEQYIRGNGPTTHLKKQGTPTVGGLIFLIPILTLTLFLVDINANIRFILYLTFGFALIGFVDDILKIKYKRSLGLTMKEKLVLQTFVSTLIYVHSHNKVETSLMVFENFSLHFDSLYFVFYTFFTVATVNATNITDGLDGLLAGIVLTTFVPFAFFTYLLGYKQVFLFIIISMGALLGFLIFNRAPAKVFMGDTGSLALGGLLVGISIITKTVFLFIMISAVLVIEALSVVIQLTSLKTRNKRVFKMAPIHHTFELMGWRETNIVKLFWLVNFTFCCLSILLFL